MQIKKAYNTTEINAMQMEILQNTNKNYNLNGKNHLFQRLTCHTQFKQSLLQCQRVSTKINFFSHFIYVMYWTKTSWL